MNIWKTALFVFIGSGIGGMLRFFLSEYIGQRMHALSRHQCSFLDTFPVATLIVNISGCLLIGMIYGAADRGINLSPEMKAMLAAGFCGGLTTFSTFSHENYLLFNSNHIYTLIIYIAVSVLLGFGAAILGHAILK